MIVSYVLPFYKRAKWLAATLPLNDCFRQSSSEVVLVLDEPSEEAQVLEIVAANPDIRFKVIVNDWEHDWRPPSIPINVGIRHATANHIVIMSPESVLSPPTPGFIERKISEDWRTMRAGLLWNIADLNSEDPPLLMRSKFLQAKAGHLPKPHGFGFLLFQKYTAEAICGLNESMNGSGGEDNEFRARMLRFGQTLVIDPLIEIFHPWHETGGSRVAQAIENMNIVLPEQRESWVPRFQDAHIIGANHKRMKIAGLMPITTNTWNWYLDKLGRITDVPITVMETSREWNDYGNRLVLLAKAARAYCDWVLWLDDDETLPPEVTKDTLLSLITEARNSGCVAVQFQRCDMWNETRWRSDGVWGKKRKVVLQRNPLTEEFVHWRSSHTQRLHALPLQVGDIMQADVKIFHHGWNSLERRIEARAKYARQDPGNVFQPGGYDYIMDDTGLELTPIAP